MNRRGIQISARPFALYLGLGATTCSMLLLQQFLTRIFSVLFTSALAFLALSITFLGLGSAGVCAAVFPRVFARERLARWIPRFALGYALSATLFLILFVQLNGYLETAAGEGAQTVSSQVQRVLIASVVMLPPMFLVGLVISLLIEAHVARVNRLYASDLLGGGIGCLLILPLMNWIGGDDGIFAIGALACLGAAGLSYAHHCHRLAVAGAVCALLVASGPALNRERALVDVRSHRSGLSGVESWVRHDREIYRTWNALSRIGIFETLNDICLYVQIDSTCQTSIPSQKPDYFEALKEMTDFELLPYALDKHERYLEIGAGGGRGMMLASFHGARGITGVEINPSIVDASLRGFPGYGVAPLVADPARALIAAEGRSYLRGLKERFDTVTITFIQTNVAFASAAFALSEANLFTVEAFGEYLDRLDEDGIFYVYRHDGNEMLRLVSIAREALAARGILDAGRHVYIARNDRNNAVFLIKPTPFSEGEAAKLDRVAADMNVKVLYSPFGKDLEKPPNPYFQRVEELRAAGGLSMGGIADLYRECRDHPGYQSLVGTYLTSPDPEGLVQRYPIDIRASTDDRPYYFFFGLNHWQDWPFYFDLDGLDLLGSLVMLLIWMFVLFAVLVAALIAFPLFFGGKRPGRRGLQGPVIFYFAGLGVTYMAVQLSFVQRFVLFLGHPVYAFSVVLLAFLVWTGLGSLLSDRVFRLPCATLGRALLLLVATLFIANLALPAIFHSALLGLPVGVKIVIALLLILPLAFQMGLLFPQGIRRIETGAPELLPWAWGANSAASVIGSILALILAIHFGFSMVSLFALAIYLAVCLPAAGLLGRRAAQ